MRTDRNHLEDRFAYRWPFTDLTKSAYEVVRMSAYVVGRILSSNSRIIGVAISLCRVTADGARAADQPFRSNRTSLSCF
jgi:hypothetical protein